MREGRVQRERERGRGGELKSLFMINIMCDTSWRGWAHLA